MPWELLLGINVIGATFRELLTKRIANKIDPFVGLFYIMLFNGVFLYICQFVTRRTLPSFDFVITLSGLFFLVAFVTYFKAIKISLSQSILFQSFSILVTIFLTAIFLGEAKYFDLRTPTGIKVILGIILAFISLWYILHVNNKKEERLERRWFVYICITIIFMGVASFINVAALSRLTTLEILINQTNSIVPVLFLLVLLQRKTFGIPVKYLQITIINSFVSIIAVLAFYSALRMTPAAKLYPIQQVLLVILTMAGGVYFYKEANILKGKRLIGVILGLIGVFLLGNG